MNPTSTAALAFGLTVAIEWPLFAWFSGLGLRRTALFCVLLNVATWFTLAGVLAQWDAPVPLLEAGVIVAETALIAFFWKWRARRAFMASALMNLTSWLLGGALLWMLLSFSNRVPVADSEQPAGRAAVGGSSDSSNSTARSDTARHNPDGGIDGSSVPVTDIPADSSRTVSQPDGDALVGGASNSADTENPPIGPDEITRDLKIKKINAALNKSPAFTVSNTTDKRATYLDWLEIEVEFSSNRAEIEDELSIEYKVEINQKICTGEVTHVDIPKGDARYSVMYISPRNLDRLMSGKKFNAPSDVANVSVTIKKQGEVLATKSLKPGPLPAVQEFSGMLVPKSETPFRYFWWDRYEAVKAH